MSDYNILAASKQIALEIGLVDTYKIFEVGKKKNIVINSYLQWENDKFLSLRVEHTDMFTQMNCFTDKDFIKAFSNFFVWHDGKLGFVYPKERLMMGHYPTREGGPKHMIINPEYINFEEIKQTGVLIKAKKSVVLW